MSDTADLAKVRVATQLAQVRMSGTGLVIPDGLKYDDWAKAGRQLSGIVDSSAWWLGDWLVFGKANYSDRYQLAIQNAGLRYQTLRNYAWVARRFPADRRRQKLTFRHHAEVASLPIEDQDRLLDQAEREEWTTKQLRTAIQHDRNGGEPQPQPVELSSRIAVPSSRVGMWRKAADHAGIDFDEWVLRMLDRAATEILLQDYADDPIEVPA
ncbi:LmbU family transcriptional regulator [Actinocrispum sp. NPDC049592]|uniref:LmbU family transcriptional regulator n=1 Tax=Actinocrispum sp. NPDC049592 TaxID=3154835 RepID=UPI003430879A